MENTTVDFWSGNYAPSPKMFKMSKRPEKLQRISRCVIILNRLLIAVGGGRNPSLVVLDLCAEDPFKEWNVISSEIQSLGSINILPTGTGYSVQRDQEEVLFTFFDSIGTGSASPNA